jgi:hypothetical protein
MVLTAAVLSLEHDDCAVAKADCSKKMTIKKYFITKWVKGSCLA